MNLSSYYNLQRIILKQFVYEYRGFKIFSILQKKSRALFMRDHREMIYYFFSFFGLRKEILVKFKFMKIVHVLINLANCYPDKFVLLYNFT